MMYDNIVTRIEGRVGVAQLNRPKALNALNRELMTELMTALEAFDADPAVGCMVITGSARAFAAGADIKEMADATPARMMIGSFIDLWDLLHRIGKLAIGDLAVVIAAAAAHRAEAFTACRAVIDRLKEHAPIWKKEFGDDGAVWVGMGP